MYYNFSAQLNDLINMYFKIENDGNNIILNNTFIIEGMEIQVAGSEAERNEMMPLLYAKTAREKANVEVNNNYLLLIYY